MKTLFSASPWCAALATVAALVAFPPASAQPYPVKPVKIGRVVAEVGVKVDGR